MYGPITWGPVAPNKMKLAEAKEWCQAQGGRLPESTELYFAALDDVPGFALDAYWAIDHKSFSARNFGTGSWESPTSEDLCCVRCVFEDKS